MAASAQTHQSYVFTDPVAFRYLEEDPSTRVVARREILKGYECYLVEQWACSRTDPTFVITTYTGDDKSQAVAGVLSMPADESLWGPRLKLYLPSLVGHYAKKKETPLGTVMVTNLSGFPSSLTVIPVPNGDMKKYREAFFVNENLKRLGCSGRVGLTLSAPNAATAAKFYQLYRASDKIPLNSAVIELVKLCQVALTLFGVLEPVYADGLLCDFTEKAISDWWLEFGTEHYRIEPHDGILGPTTVAALLGTLIGARNRLHAYGAPIAKDVFDIESTKRAIQSFQKTHRMPRTRRLDRQTLEKIHRSTAKAASKDGWFVPRAVKSTVAELSGKGGEMVMDMVGAGNKAGIAEVETVDIEQFLQHIHGARAKWLWQGKPRKSSVDGPARPEESRRGIPHQVTSQEQGDSPTSPQQSDRTELDEKERTRFLKKQPEKSSSGRHHDSGRGLGRLKGAVGLKHASKPSKDDFDTPDSTTPRSVPPLDTGSQLPLVDNKDSDTTTGVFSPPSLQSNAPEAKFGKIISETPAELSTVYLEHLEPPSDDEPPIEFNGFPPPSMPSPYQSASPSIAGSVYRGIDLEELFEKNELPTRPIGPLFKRTQSFARGAEIQSQRNPARWPRHLSFSLAEDSVLSWTQPQDLRKTEDENGIVIIPGADAPSHLRKDLSELEFEVANWVDAELRKVQEMQLSLDSDQKDLDDIYQNRSEEYRDLASGSKEVMEIERAHLEEGVQELEVLGAKLEYEINVLRGKVEDVEDGVLEFERQVTIVEERVTQLEYTIEHKESWVAWILRILHFRSGPYVASMKGKVS